VRSWLFVLAACGSSSSHGVPGGDAPPDQSADIGSADSGVCGNRPGQRGATHRTMTVAGLARTYTVYLPMADDPHVPVPLVFVHHGYTMSGQEMFDITGYPALADSEHIALAFPDGQAGPNSLGAPWNVGDNVCASSSGAPPDATGDDNAFLDAMKTEIQLDQCIDLAHVYVTGFSMGGYFSHQAGCTRPDIRAVAPHSGGTHSLDQCANAKEPIIIFHGTSDPVIPESCDQTAATAWAAHNGCGTTTHSIAVTQGTCVVWDGCPTGGQVELCTFDNMGHCWAGGASGSVFACTGYEPATQLEWNFFKQYAW
jgi:poly(3-hydroxybutyrate) depolymerase